METSADAPEGFDEPSDEPAELAPELLAAIFDLAGSPATVRQVCQSWRQSFDAGVFQLQCSALPADGAAATAALVAKLPALRSVCAAFATSLHPGAGELRGFVTGLAR
jgi:hypothetical protein